MGAAKESMVWPLDLGVVRTLQQRDATPDHTNCRTRLVVLTDPLVGVVWPGPKEVAMKIRTLMVLLPLLLTRCGGDHGGPTIVTTPPPTLAPAPTPAPTPTPPPD